MTTTSGPGELGAFLKARRAQLAPQDLGLPEQDSRRKVAGIRREEVAQLRADRHNYLHLLFTEPIIRDMHLEWEHDARDAVAALRMESAANPGDPELARLVGELSVRDADFRTWWAEHRVNNAAYGTKRYRHRLVGDLTLDCDTWSSPDGSGQRLMVLTAEPGSPSHDGLRILTSWVPGQTTDTDLERR